MKFLEKDLEQIIFETPNENLQEHGLAIEGKKKRQVKIGNYGVADLITYSKPFFNGKDARSPHDPLRISIYELKQQKIGTGTLLQAARYYKGICSYLDKRCPKLRYEIEIVLIGSELELNTSFVYLAEFMEQLNIVTYNYDFTGIQFKHEYGYKLTEEGFYCKKYLAKAKKKQEGLDIFS